MMARFLLALSICAALVAPSLAARHIDVQIIINGKVVMTAPYSDDGRQNADQIWNAMKDVKFRVRKGADVTLVALSLDQRLYEIASQGTLDVQYAGKYEFERVQFFREEDANGESVWKINPKQLTKWFDARLIRRRDAESLISKDAP